MWVVRCGDGISWVKSLCSCIPDAVIQTPEFYSVVFTDKTCRPGIVDTATKFEALRFCTAIAGDLVIRDLPADAVLDLTVLHWIRSIAGMSAVARSENRFSRLVVVYELFIFSCKVSLTLSGSLVVVNNSAALALDSLTRLTTFEGQSLVVRQGRPLLVWIEGD